RGEMSGPLLSLTGCRITRSTMRATHRSAAGRAHVRLPQARMSERVDGLVRRRRNVACTLLIAVNFDAAPRTALSGSPPSWTGFESSKCDCHSFSGLLGIIVPMKISAKAEYECLAALALARHGPDAAPLRIREISGPYGIPERYLVQILLQLKGAGLVKST